MPVMVIGADTTVGGAVVDAVLPAAAEVRAFVSDERSVDDLRRRGVKVALGDLSDSSHVEAATLNCFCAVLIVDAATDGRTLSFAGDLRAVVDGWTGALRSAGIRRTIWVSSEAPEGPFPAPSPEVATVLVGGDIERAIGEVARLEGLRSLPT